MPTAFALTFDSTYGSLVLVTGERIIDDVTDIRITKTATGYDCELTRAGGDKLVASASPAGKQALERANGRVSSSAPGFIEVTASASTTVSSVDGVAACFGWVPPTEQG